MADPAHPPGDSHRRDRRRELKRQRTRRVFSVVGMVVVLLAFVLVATDLVRFGGDDKPSLASPVAASVGAHAATTTTGARNCRALTSDDPLRLWIGGDSLAGSLGPSLGALTGATGVVQPYFDSRVSSGLADPGFFDWPDHATTEMARLDPEVVVFIIGTNDWAAVSGDWKNNYTDVVNSMMDTLVGSGRTVYWLGGPTLKDQQMDTALQQVNAVAQDVAKRHPKVHFVDTHQLFSDADGGFSYDLPDENGKVVTMRAGDGVHFTEDGADYLARAVYKLVDAQCAVTDQKVADATKTPIETEGSTQVAPGSGSSSGSSSSSGSGSNSGSGSSGGGTGTTVATTPPAPAPTQAPIDTTPATTVATQPTTPTTVAPSAGGTPQSGATSP